MLACRHAGRCMMPFTSINEGSIWVSMTWRAVSMYAGERRFRITVCIIRRHQARLSPWPSCKEISARPYHYDASCKHEDVHDEAEDLCGPSEGVALRQRREGHERGAYTRSLFSST